MGSSVRPLHSGFLRSADLHPDCVALEVDGATLTFADLAERAGAMAATLAAREPSGGTSFTAVFAERSAVAFAGVLASLLRGHGYVPLSPGAPGERTRSMLERSGSRAIVADRRSAERLDEVLEGVTERLVILLPEHDSVDHLARRWPGHTVLGASDLEPARTGSGDPVAADTPAYLLFTSGSTGVPKGVMVTHGNVRHLVDAMVERYQVSDQDRFSQMFDLTFDLSVFDLFVAWEVGARVCCPSGTSVIAPGEFIRSSELTVWFSVPSTAIIMKRLGLLKPGRYPTLRWSLFCGEALPLDIATCWAEAAPASTVENLYGPTEATVACTAYRFDPQRSPAESELGLVPIGAPLPGLRTEVVDEGLEVLGRGADGELVVAGPQVTPGYWRDPDKTASAFVVPPGQASVYYRTGDRVRRQRPGGPLCYVGRLDNQIKVHGHRVELGEIEAHLREASKLDAAVALGWPATAAGASGIVAFLAGGPVDLDGLRAELARRLPDYMVPRTIRVLAELPTNANGKFDRPALRALLDGDR